MDKLCKKGGISLNLVLHPCQRRECLEQVTSAQEKDSQGEDKENDKSETYPH